MDKKADFFQKKLSNTRSFTRQKKTSNAWIWIVIVLLLLIWWIIGWKIFFAHVDLDKVEPDTESNFSLWEEVHLQWEIKEDRDFATHTHKLDDLNYGEVRLKSDSENLSDYVGFVELTWVVEKFYVWTQPIVRVTAISWTILDSDESVDMVLDENPGYSYLSEAGILFLPSFYEKYTTRGDWKNGEIIVENPESNEEFVINYFRCNPADPNRNCKWLTETFSNNNAQSFVTSEWDVYYKQSEVQSWFVANWDWRGVFINDVPDDEIFELKDMIKFANKKNIDEWIKFRAMRICQWSGEKLQNIKKSEINLKQEWLIVTVSWDGMEKEMTCQILVDFNSPAKWELQSLTIWEDVVVSDESEEEKTEEAIQEEKKDESQVSATAFDTNVPQFQLKKECIENPGKEGCLKYESVRWGYILNFPSPSISFVVSPIKENFGRNDLNCSYVINVIKITEKENLEISPAIRVYECQWSIEKSWAPGIVVYSTLDKKFVVQMNDWAWNDFSMNLKFEELIEE